MTTPAEQTIYTWVSDGSASYTVPMWIFQASDITVFYNGAEQDSADWSVSSITDDDFSLTLASPPLTGVTITVARDVIVTEPDNFSPGAPLTAEDLNYKFDFSYIIENDTQYYGTNIVPKYSVTDLVSPTDPLQPEDVLLPKLSTPGIDDSPRVWAKDSTGVFIDAPLDSSGITAAELKDELAVNTSAIGSGANIVGYFSSSIGGTTVQAALDSIDNPDTIAHYTAATGEVVIANALQDSAATADYWAEFKAPASVGTFATESVFGDGSGAGAETMYTLIGGTHIRLYTAGTGGGSSAYPDGVVSWSQGSPAVPIPATGITDTALATKGYVYNSEEILNAKIDAITAGIYPVGKIIFLLQPAAGHGSLPSVPGFIQFRVFQSGLISELYTIGNGSSGASHENDIFKALFLYMWETGSYSSATTYLTTEHTGWYVDGGAGASATADWDAGKKLYMQPPYGVGSNGMVSAEQTLAVVTSTYTHTPPIQETQTGMSGFIGHCQWPYICYGAPA